MQLDLAKGLLQAAEGVEARGADAYVGIDHLVFSRLEVVQVGGPSHADAPVHRLKGSCIPVKQVAG